MRAQQIFVSQQRLEICIQGLLSKIDKRLSVLSEKLFGRKSQNPLHTFRILSGQIKIQFSKVTVTLLNIPSLRSAYNTKAIGCEFSSKHGADLLLCDEMSIAFCNQVRFHEEPRRICRSNKKKSNEFRCLTGKILLSERFQRSEKRTL